MPTRKIEAATAQRNGTMMIDSVRQSGETWELMRGLTILAGCAIAAAPLLALFKVAELLRIDRERQERI